MGLLGTLSAVGTALGPTLGGVLIATLGWPSIFLVNVPLGILAFALAHRFLPADRPTLRAGPARFDLMGTLLLALTLAAYALAATIGSGRPGWLNGALLAAAALGALLFLAAEATARAPLIPVAQLRDPVLGASLATSAIVSTVIMATLVVWPFYLARALGLATAQVGLVMSAGPVIAALAGVPAGRIVDRFGAQRMTVAGLAGMLLGCSLLCLAPAALGIAGFVIPIGALTASYALFQAANNTAVMADVRPGQRGVISGMLNLARNLGLVTGASVLGAVFAIASHGVDVTAALPESIAIGMRATFATASALVIAALAIAIASRTLSGPAYVSEAQSARHQ
jgi:MFS family permease